KVMVAPGVIRSDVAARSGRLKRSPEVGEREGGHLTVQAELDGGVVERGDGLTHLHEQARLRSELILVRVEASELTEENLTVGSERGRRRVELDHLRNLLQLIAQCRVRKRRGQRHIGVERLADVDGLLRRAARG